MSDKVTVKVQYAYGNNPNLSTTVEVTSVAKATVEQAISAQKDLHVSHVDAKRIQVIK